MRSSVKDGARRKVLIVGAGMAGLTAGAYLARAGHEVILLEKSPGCGGLVSSFTRDGFVFDTGPRAVGNAGILVPLLEDLDIDLPLVKGEVSTGIRDKMVHYDSNANIDDFIASLHGLFPESSRDIEKIRRQIRVHTRMAAVLNELPNPFFKNPLKDPGYLFTKFIPWLPSFFRVVLRTSLGVNTVEEVLKSLTGNRALADMVCQHFFKGTPAHFAFGYFENYQDYQYPPGGTGKLPEALARKFAAEGGVFRYGVDVMTIDPAEKKVTDQAGEDHDYDALVWAADLKSLYGRMEVRGLPVKQRHRVDSEKKKYLAVAAGESVFTIFLAVDEPPETFKAISRGHFIYTPRTEGLGELHRSTLARMKADFPRVTREEWFRWLEDFCALNSYEISIPVLKDPSLAPPGKTGLIVSLLMDGGLWELADRAGWAEELRAGTAECMLRALEEGVYPGLRGKILFQKTATPLTLMRMFNTTHGAITGWSLEEESPVPHSLAGITGTPRTAVPGVFKAGQWSYSPSGVPIALLTGRIAARAVQQALKG